MKTINIIFITALLVSPVVAKHPTIHPTLNGVVRTDLGALSLADKGFIKYIGDFGGYEVIALSSPGISSAFPSEDLRIYLKKGDEYHKAISLPQLKRKGYICVRHKDSLQIFTTTSYGQKQPQKGAKPVSSVNLKQLIKKAELEVGTNCSDTLGVYKLFGSDIRYYAWSGELDKVKELLEKDPTFLESRSECGETPLLSAIRKSYKASATVKRKDEVIDYLVTQGANISATNNFGSGTLHLAAEHEQPQLAVKFIKLGLDVNLQNDKGDTPLHDAAKFAHCEMIKVLLEANAEEGKKNANGQTPLDKAYASRNRIESANQGEWILSRFDMTISLLRNAEAVSKKERYPK
ncbi:MAG: ankyrin repeat domain-containing protein [Kiritimatiellae bacterium]|nr:ankyrin repeat domain-containing protein [Kiritimatiellia bacterium]